MQQLKEDTICKYCLGCNKLLNMNFNGTRNCKKFIAGYINWRELYERALKKAKENRGNK